MAALLSTGCGGAASSAAPLPSTAVSVVGTAMPPSTPETAPTRPGRQGARPATRTPVSRPTRTTIPGASPTNTPGGRRRIPTTTAAAALRAPASDVEIVLPDHPDRPARLHLPSRPAGDTVPLLIALHGSYSDADTLAGYTDLDALAEAAGWAVLWPQGGRVDGVRAWNAGTCCSPASEAGTDDVGYLGALLDDVLATDPIDRAEVVVVGHSNGAFMAYTVACRLADRFAAVVAVSGGLATGCEPARPISVLAVHGTGDESVAYSLGAASARRWRDLDGCSTESSTDQGAVRIETWTGCDDGVEVRLVTLAGAPHAWPGGPASAPDGFDASVELFIWLATLAPRRA